jgi:hypothetical protein
MKQTIIAFIYLMFCLDLNSQTVPKPDSSVVQAKYLKGDLTGFLSGQVKYDAEALRLNIYGDVLFSFTINKDGRLVNLNLQSSPDFGLTNSSMTAMKTIVEGWSPALINNVPADKKYLIVFRYRIYLNTTPRDYSREVNKLIEKGKYERALTLCREATASNMYDFSMVELRSQIKEKLGDIEGAKNDRQAALKLREEIITVVNVYAIGVTRRVAVEVGSEIRKL